VEITYLSFWDHGFFGIADGMVQSFTVGKAPLNAGGEFEIEIPDFSRDPVTNQRKDACLEVHAPGHSVLPPKELQCPFGLGILPSYGSEIAFSARKN
jgi:hypothetical protein